MKAYLISDNHDTLVGMKLAGIDGVVVHGYDEASGAMEKALERTDVAILAVTEKIAELLPDAMQRLREQGELPIVVEIPDRHGTKRGPGFLTKYVRDAIGVKME
ncbi:MAG: V-type ATP synthase subunit F [Synergistaceae bacterium]|jgi:V/A-type H+-transporting ATPase subunit F|nr:V-type ATP synthase subunit F [Synergistaceae bacterium]